MKSDNRPATPIHRDRHAPLPKDLKIKSDATVARNITPKAANKQTVKNHIFEMISPPRPGLMIVTSPNQHLLTHARHTVEQSILAESDNLSIPLPEVDELLSLYSGGPRKLEQARALAVANMPVTKAVKHIFEAHGTQDGFGWCTDEGFWALEPIIEETARMITLQQEIAFPIKPTVVDYLSRIRHVAKQSGSWVVVFVVYPQNHKESPLDELCDEYIEVAECEPSPGADIAFSIDCVGLRDLNLLGIGKTMCSVTLSNGAFQRSFEPYLSSDLETRIMWILRGQNKTLEEIGKIMDMDKTTVMRRLKGLPAPRNLKMENDWLEPYLELLSVSKSTASDDAEDDTPEDGEN